jgi:hypothetical protein
MAREIQRTRRTQTVSPSGTASRMGVVDVYTPNISQMFNVAADTMNTLAENQIKILDAKWQNNFETETTKYLNEKVNNILESGEKPDLTRFQEEADGYINGVLSNVPERLSINAEAYFNQKNLNAFEILRKKANLIEFNEGNDAYVNNVNSALLDFDNFINNTLQVAESPQAVIDAFNNYSLNDLSQFLGSHAEKFNALIALSNNKLSLQDRDKAEQALLVEIEQRRVNAIVKSFYQNIDINNISDVEEADRQAANFLNSYALNEGGVRGVNYDVFKNEVGESIGQDVIDSIVNKGVTTLNTINNINERRFATSKAEKTAIDKLAYDNQLNLLKDTSNFEGDNSLFIERSVSARPGFGPQDIKPQGIEFFINQFPSLTDTEQKNLYKANKAKFKVKLIMDKAALNNEKFSTLIDSSEFDEDVTLLGGREKLLENYYGYVLGDSFIDIATNYDRLTSEELSRQISLFKKENYIPSGFAGWLSGLDIPSLVEMDEATLLNTMGPRLSKWKELTNNGRNNDIGNLTTPLDNLYEMMFGYEENGFTYPQIVDAVNKRMNMSPEKFEQLNKINESYIDENKINSKELFIDWYVESSKVRYQTELSPELVDGKVVQKIEVSEEAIRDEAEMLYSKNSVFINSLISDDRVLEHFNALSTLDDNAKQKERRLQNSINRVFKNLEYQDYGVSNFMDNDKGPIFTRNAVEEQHNMEDSDIRNSLAAYTYNAITEILKDETHDLYEPLRDLLSIDDVLQMPTLKQVFELVDNNHVYLEAIENGQKGARVDYKVKLNTSGSKYDEALYYTEIDHLTFDNSFFNPTMETMFKILSKENIANKVMKELDPSILESFIMPKTPDLIKQMDTNTPSKGNYLDVIEQNIFGSLRLWEAELIGSFTGEFDLDELQAKLIEQARNDKGFLNYLSYQQEHKNVPFTLFKEKKNVYDSVTTNLLSGLNIEKTEVNDEKLKQTFQYVENEYFNYSPVTKSIIASMIINKGVELNELKEAIQSSDVDKINTMIGGNEEVKTFLVLHFRDNPLVLK